MTSVFHIDTPSEKHSVSWSWIRDSLPQASLYEIGFHLSKWLTEEQISTITTTEIIVRQRRATNLPDVFGRSVGPHIVSERAKLFIERFEPSVHQFVRVQIRDRRGVSAVRPYWLLHILNMADGYDVEQSKLLKETTSRGNIIYSLAAPGAKRVIVPEKVKGLHFWRDKKMKDFYASEEFKRAATQERLTGFKFKKCELVKRGKGGST